MRPTYLLIILSICLLASANGSIWDNIQKAWQKAEKTVETASKNAVSSTE